MLRCWQDAPDARPTFTELANYFDHLVTRSSPTVSIHCSILYSESLFDLIIITMEMPEGIPRSMLYLCIQSKDFYVFLTCYCFKTSELLGTPTPRVECRWRRGFRRWWRFLGNWPVDQPDPSSVTSLPQHTILSLDSQYASFSSNHSTDSSSVEIHHARSTSPILSLGDSCSQ